MCVLQKIPFFVDMMTRCWFQMLCSPRNLGNDCHLIPISIPLRMSHVNVSSLHGIQLRKLRAIFVQRFSATSCRYAATKHVSNEKKGPWLWLFRVYCIKDEILPSYVLCNQGSIDIQYGPTFFQIRERKTPPLKDLGQWITHLQGLWLFAVRE